MALLAACDQVDSKDTSSRDGAVGEVSYRVLGGADRVLVCVQKSDKRYFCAEPPPDAASALAQSFAAELATKASAGVSSGEVSAAIQNSRNEKLLKLFERSQGIQALRDGMYRLCEARTNDFINNDTFESQMTQLIATLNFVVPIELCTEMLASSNYPLENVNFDECVIKAYQFGEKITQLEFDRLQAKLTVDRFKLERDIFELEKRQFEEFLKMGSSDNGGGGPENTTKNQQSPSNSDPAQTDSVPPPKSDAGG